MEAKCLDPNSLSKRLQNVEVQLQRPEEVYYEAFYDKDIKLEKTRVESINDFQA